MGCDGGTIPRRDELVRTKKKPEQKDKTSELSFRWQHCAISQEPLRTPIVACGLGRLYSKDVVIEALLERSTLPELAQHIKNLKDIRDVQLTSNPAFKTTVEKGDTYMDMHTVPYVCPVIGLEMNGKFRFVFLWKCGCVMSERAMKEVKTKLCHKCQQPFTEEDVVILNGTEEDVHLMKIRMEARQVKIKAEKKARSNSKQNKKIDATVTSDVASTTSCYPDPNSNPSTSSMPTEVKLNGNTSKSTSVNTINVGLNVSSKEGVKTAKRSANGKFADPRFKKTKGDYSIAKDPKATDVFKSLFTSHSTAHEQTRAHWVTYNPFYN